ncbi:unnamed protein product [Coregonus sp. 'balchen']|nr:unnamed protein product [Coregonus sp. 'balchen']
MGFPQDARSQIAAVPTRAESLEGFKAYSVFQEIEKKLQESISLCSDWVTLQEGKDVVKKIGGVFAFKVKDGPEGRDALWVVDVKNGQGSVSNDAGVCLSVCLSVYKKADCTITMGDEDLMMLMTGKMNPQTVSL